MNFTPESEYEVIREAVSHKLDRLLENQSKKFGETQIKLKLQLPPSRFLTLYNTHTRDRMIWYS